MPNSDWLVHEQNIDDKTLKNYKSRGQDFLTFKTKKYLPYKNAQSKITVTDQRDISKRVKLLELYLDEVDSFNQGKWITAQSKFRPTVLEEFCGWLFKDLPQMDSMELAIFKRDVYAGLDIDKNGKVRVRTKDIDFCIGKIVEGEIAKKPIQIRIPIVCVECKTYIDNTMFSEAQFTAQKLKGGSPGIKVFVITETNAIDILQLPSQTPVDQIYVFRERKGSPLDAKVVWGFFCEVRSAVERVSIEKLITLPGKLLLS